MPDFTPLVRSCFAERGREPGVDVVEELAQHAAGAWDAARADGLTDDIAMGRVRMLVAAWCDDPRVAGRRPKRPRAIDPPTGSGRVFAGSVQDVRYAARLLRREPRYAAIAIATMALGIAAATTLFSAVYGVLMKPLPWPDADRLVRATEMRDGRTHRLRGTISNGSYLAWSDQPATIEALGGFQLGPVPMPVNASAGSEPLRVGIGRLTPSMFHVLKAAPVRGRAFVPEDARAGSGAYPTPRVVILSYGLWQELFGGREDVIGAGLRIDGSLVTIVGIMPREFAFPDRETRAWLPMAIAPVMGDKGVRRIMVFGALARLKPGVTFAQAAAEATGLARRAPDPGYAAVAMFGSAAAPEVVVTSAVDAMTADVRPALIILLVAVVLLFATATANVANLQLARAVTRHREIAVRVALGAGGARLVRQLIVESALVSVGGGALGVLLAIGLHRVLPSLLPADFPRLDDIAINGPVLIFAVVVSIIASVVCGLLPGLLARRINVVDALADDGSTSTSGGWRSRRGHLGTIIMAGQVAVACVLLVGAALLARSFVALIRAERGYDPANLLTAQVDLDASYDGPRRAAFADAVIERMRGVSGVSHVAAGNALPFISPGGSAGFGLPSPTDPGIKQDVQTLIRLVSPGYFQTLRLRVLQGRVLTETDTLTSRPVVVVNRSFAQRYLGSSPVGTRLPFGFGPGRFDCDVVGIVEDMRQASVTEPPVPELFVLYRQLPARLLNGPLIFVLRTTDHPMALVPMLRAAVREREPAAPLSSVTTMEELLMTNLAQPRLYAVLLGVFGLFALIIAGVGLFGVLSYTVAQRSREIGVRTALGAQTSDIVALVLKHAAAVALSGLAIGLVAALALSRFLQAFLYGIAAHDAISFVAAALALMLAAAIACLVPARRAARIDPLIALYKK